MLTVVSVAYPLAPVRADTAGGAEQVLRWLDEALVRAGHRSIVVACEGSRTAGELVAVPRVSGPLDPERIGAARERHRDALCELLHRVAVDVVHMHGIDFHAYLPPAGVPVLATLHLPVDWYEPHALRPGRPATFVHCVSTMQHATCPSSDRLLPPIENGVPVEEFSGRWRRHWFALMLTRICREKGVHIAIDAAKAARVPLIIAGEVFPYPEHERYFAEEVQPRLDARRRFVGPVGAMRKQRLLREARCLLAPSLAAETSSLAAREALACGTPVIAFRRGALAAVVEHGRTGFLVDDTAGMAQAIEQVRKIDPEVCRSVARERFPLQRMIEQYLATYAMLAGRRRNAADAA